MNTPELNPTAQKTKADRSPSASQERVDGEHPSFQPDAAPRKAPPQASDHKALPQAPDEVASNLHAMSETFTSMQLAARSFFDDLLWRSMSWTAFPSLRPADPFKSLGALSSFGLPLADIREGRDAYTLCVELPGLAPEDMTLRTRGDVLTLAGHKRESKSAGEGPYHVSERRYGEFERNFPLPTDVDHDAIKAKFQNGVLSVALPKSAGSSAGASRPIRITT